MVTLFGIFLYRLYRYYYSDMKLVCLYQRFLAAQYHHPRRDYKLKSKLILSQTRLNKTAGMEILKTPFFVATIRVDAGAKCGSGQPFDAEVAEWQTRYVQGVVSARA
jgi:hypothetical protein